MMIDVIDFFSGCGGTAAGMREAGLNVLLAVDNDPDAAETFRINFPEAIILDTDIKKLDVESIAGCVNGRQNVPLLFSACAPCQPFSKQRRTVQIADDRIPLLLEFVRFVRRFLPDYVFVENVPGMQTMNTDEGPFGSFVVALDEMGYKMTVDVIKSQQYGVPQRRERLILLASKSGEISFPPFTHGPGTDNPVYSTVGEWIGDLPPLVAGGSDPDVPNHRAANLSELNLQRIRATSEGGGWHDWPLELVLDCHRDGYSGHSDVYGRMRSDAPASGLTTRCISYSNGRFGHPTQDRAISVREAACLQTFPRDFSFTGSMAAQARQIGNAVPVLLAKVFGEHIVSDYSSRQD